MRRRAGMTLVEIMIALVLLGIVSGVLMRVILRQQRFYQGANQIMSQRGQLRQATAVLPIDLRSLSSVGADLLAVSDSAIEFNVNIGTGIICELISGGIKVALPPQSLAAATTTGNTFTTFYGYGEPSDSAIAHGVTVYIYNDSSVVGNEDDRWQKFTLKAMHGDGSSCATSSFVTISDAGKRRPILELEDPDGKTDPITGGPISQYIGVGAPVRLVKRVRYHMFKNTDNKWYLGFSEFYKSDNKYGPEYAVSGPYDAYSTSSGTPSGLRFRYFDVDGSEIASGADSASRSRIARIDLVARARTSAIIKTAGVQNGASQQYRDSLAVSVMVRNRQ